MELTEQERQLLRRVRNASRWDSLWWELSYLIPSFIIVGIGIWNNSAMVTFTGIVVFMVFRARFEIHQAKQFPVFKGLCEKIEAMTTANKASHATSKLAPGADSSACDG